MNLYSGGKRKFKNRIKSNREIQLIHLSDGCPKGIKLILEEREL